MVDLDKINFENPDRCYLFTVPFRGSDISFFAHFNPEADNTRMKPIIMEFIDRMERLACIAHESMPLDHEHFVEYFASHLFEQGYAFDDELIKLLFGHTDRQSISPEDLHRSLVIGNIAFHTERSVGVFDFSPDPSRIEQWLAMKVHLDGTPKELSWES